MIKYETGTRFPHEKYLNKGEITVAMLHEMFFDVVCVLSGISSEERKDWRKGNLIVYLYEQNNIPFIVFAFDKWNFDVNINVGKINNSQLNEWLNSNSNIINLFLIESTSGILDAMRMISIPGIMAERIRDICEIQSERNSNYVDNIIESTLAGVSTGLMIKHAEMKYKIK